MTSLLLLCLHFLLIFQFSHDALKLSTCIILFSPANLACFSCILLVHSHYYFNFFFPPHYPNYILLSDSISFVEISLYYIVRSFLSLI